MQVNYDGPWRDISGITIDIPSVSTIKIRGINGSTGSLDPRVTARLVWGTTPGSCTTKSRCIEWWEYAPGDRRCSDSEEWTVCTPPTYGRYKGAVCVNAECAVTIPGPDGWPTRFEAFQNQVGQTSDPYSVQVQLGISDACTTQGAVNAVACLATSPSKPGLISPYNGSISGPNTKLVWMMAPGSTWGKQCPGGTNNPDDDRYRVYVSTNPTPTTRVADTLAGNQANNYEMSFNFIGLPDTKYYWRVGAWNGSGETLSDTYSFTVSKQAFFQAGGGGGVTAASSLSTWVPPGKTLLVPDAANTDGVVVAAGFTGVTRDTASTKKWLVDVTGDSWSARLARKANTYAGLKDKLLIQATPLAIPTGSLDQAGLNPLLGQAGSVNQVRGMTVLQRSGNLTLSGDLDLGDNQVVLLVDGSLDITGKVNLNDNRGLFFALVQERIWVGPDVGEGTYQDITAAGYSPHLEGVFFAQMTFGTQTTGLANGDKQLRVDGMVIGLGGVLMRRDIVAAGTWPAEYYHFRPEMSLQLMQAGLHRYVYEQQVAP